MSFLFVVCLEIPVWDLGPEYAWSFSGLMASKYTEQAFSRINLFDSLKLFKVPCFGRHASLQTPHKSCFCKYLCHSTFWCYRTRMRFEHVDCNLEETEPAELRSLSVPLKNAPPLICKLQFLLHISMPLYVVSWTKGFLHELQEWLFFWGLITKRFKSEPHVATLNITS